MKEDTQRIDELVGKLRFSELSDAEQSELDALLQRNPEARRRFVGHWILESDLHEDAAGLLSAPPQISVLSRLPRMIPLALAAAVALGIGVWLFQFNFSPEAGGARSGEPSVAVVRRAVDSGSGGDTQAGASSLHGGQVLYPGAVEVADGLVQLDLYNGVSLVLEGPAGIDIVSPDLVILNAGKVRANVPPPARGFRLIAGEHELIDLGTEFGVSLGADGEGELHVIDGEVEVHSKKDPDREAKLMRTGTAMSLKRDGSTAEIAEDGARFSGGSAVAKRETERFAEWKKEMEQLAADPDTVLLFDFQTRKDNRLRNLVSQSGQEIEGVVVGCETGDGRWTGKSSLKFSHPSDRVRVEIPRQFEQLTMASWVKADSIKLLSLPLIQSEGKQERSLFWVLHHGHRDKPMAPHFAETTDPADEKGDRRNYLSAAKVLSGEQTGRWMHFSVTFDNAAGKVTHYVNGHVVDRHEIESPRPLGIGLADIGNWPSRDWAKGTKWEVRHLIGDMDEFLISRRAFSETEIKQLYRAGRP